MHNLAAVFSKSAMVYYDSPNSRLLESIIAKAYALL